MDIIFKVFVNLSSTSPMHVQFWLQLWVVFAPGWRRSKQMNMLEEMLITTNVSWSCWKLFQQDISIIQNKQSKQTVQSHYNISNSQLVHFTKAHLQNHPFYHQQDQHDAPRSVVRSLTYAVSVSSLPKKLQFFPIPDLFSLFLPHMPNSYCQNYLGLI